MKTVGTIQGGAARKYFSNLVNRLFKILPLREAEDATLPAYLYNLHVELAGLSSFDITGEPEYISLLAQIHYLRSHEQLAVLDVKHIVFDSISLCNRLSAKCRDGVTFTIEEGGD